MHIILYNVTYGVNCMWLYFIQSLHSQSQTWELHNKDKDKVCLLYCNDINLSQW